MTPKEKHDRRQARRNAVHQAKEDKEFAEEYSRTWPTVPYFHGQTSPVDFRTPALAKLRDKIRGKSRIVGTVKRTNAYNGFVPAMLRIGRARAKTDRTVEAVKPIRNDKTLPVQSTPAV
jgi:hypothetical protein